jgi:putative aldouronate transport system substrate-binding protein
MKETIRWVYLLALTVLLIPAAVCTGTGEKAGSDTGKPVDLQIVIRHIGYTRDNNNVIAQELNKRLNLKIDWVLKPAENYPQQCALLIASASYPDAMEYWCAQYPNELQQLADDKVIRPVDDLLAKYGKEITEEVRPKYTWFVSKTDGKRYGIPTRFNEMKSNTAFQIRSDWLKKLNLEVPDSSAQLFNVLSAFKKNSDLLVGKGNQLIPYGGINPFTDGLRTLILSENGSTDAWNVLDGKVVYYVNMPGYKESLRTLRNLFQAGLVEPEYPMMNREMYLDKWYKNIYGCWTTWVDNLNAATDAYIQIYMKAYPQAELAFLYPFPDKAGVRRMAGGIVQIQAVIFKKTSDEKAAALVKLWNYMLSPEGSDLVEMGIQGTNWSEDTMTPGKAVFTPPLLTEDRAKLGYYSYNWSMKRWYFPRWNATITRNIGLSYAKHCVVPPVIATTPEALKNGTVMSDIVRTSEVELICSKNINFDSAFDAYVSKWNGAGGKKWTDEMNAEYRPSK